MARLTCNICNKYASDKTSNYKRHVEGCAKRNSAHAITKLRVGLKQEELDPQTMSRKAENQPSHHDPDLSIDNRLIGPPRLKPTVNRTSDADSFRPDAMASRHAASFKSPRSRVAKNMSLESAPHRSGGMFIPVNNGGVDTNVALRLAASEARVVELQRRLDEVDRHLDQLRMQQQDVNALVLLMNSSRRV